MLFVFVSLIILTCVSVLVLSSTIITWEQYHYPTSAQRLLLPQIAVLSAQSETSENNIPSNILDEDVLEIESVTEGLQSPTSMTFIGSHGDMLILEKHGEVIHFINENKTKKSVLNFSAVDDRNERGLLGVAVIDATPVPSTEIDPARGTERQVGACEAH
jgi:glucose/arabinose dehydrogenase